MATSPVVLTYSRVSTSHHDQKPEVQVEELRRYCTARGWQVGYEIVERGYSGGTDQRPGLKQLMELVRARRVDIVIVTKLDRMARSLRHLVTLLDELAALQVQFISVSDQIDMTTAGGRLLTHLLGAFAEFERSLVRERTLAGLRHAKAKGKRLGRPQIHDGTAIQRLRAQGFSYRAIARELKVPMGTITRAIRGAHKTLSKTPQKSPTKSGRPND